MSFPAGTTMAGIQAAGTVVIGVKSDQPGVGFRNVATGEREGFDIEIAKIGFRRGDTAFCEFLTETLRLAREDGSWAKAFERTLGKAGVPMPAPPDPKPCRTA